MSDPAGRLHPQPVWTGPIDYHLPPELIAQRPTKRREDARMMVVDRHNEEIRHATLADLPEMIGAGEVVVANDSRVFPARIVGRKPTGGRVELLILATEPPAHIPALAGTAKPLRTGQAVEFADGSACTVVEVGAGGRCVLDFGRVDVRDLLARHGHVPLPPYIERGRRATDDVADRERYQTVYAEHEGSVAAPTAGLHLSEAALARIRERGGAFRTITLHVGPGTFVPLRGAPELHAMEAERCTVTAGCAAAVNRVREAGHRLIAIGTTTVRALESACGGDGRLAVYDGETDLFIRPGHRFGAVDALLTNFHLPHSTLLCLVLAFGGEPLVREAYERAVRDGYRFYSYGDAMLVL